MQMQVRCMWRSCVPVPSSADDGSIRTEGTSVSRSFSLSALVQSSSITTCSPHTPRPRHDIRHVETFSPLHPADQTLYPDQTECSSWAIQGPTDWNHNALTLLDTT
jgi:hypothetical protein